MIDRFKTETIFQHLEAIERGDAGAVARFSELCRQDRGSAFKLLLLVGLASRGLGRPDHPAVRIFRGETIH